MTRRPLLLLLAVVTAALLARAQPSASDIQAQQVQASGTGIVAGQVIDATTKQPVGGAVVTLTVAPAAPGQPAIPAAQARRGVAVANADGRFLFRDMPAGTYSLASTRNNYAPGATGRRRPGGSSGSFTLDEGARLTDAVIPMWRLASISGFVRDDRGEPAIGVSVTAMRRAMSGGRFELSFAGGGGEATDDRGRYRVNGLMPGSYVVGVRTSTRSASVSTVDAFRGAVTSGSAAGMTREAMESGGLQMSTAGLVMDGWQVSVSSSMSQPLPGPNGTLLIQPTVFYGNAKSPSDATILTLAAGDDRPGIDLTLPLVAGMRVSGMLSGPTGPAAGHGVRLVPAGSTEPVFDVSVADGTTDAAGRFALLGVPPGAYVLRAYRVPQTAPMMRPPPPPAAGAPPIAMGEMVAPPAGPPAATLFAEVPVAVGATHVGDLAVVLQPGARLSGRVAFEGATAAPLAAQLSRITVSLRPVTGTTRVGDTRVDAAGGFQTAGYAPGRYLVNVTPPGPEWTLASVRVAGVNAAGQAFTLGTSDVEDVIVTFTDKVMTLSGTVRAADSGGDPDATVVVLPADVRAWLETGMSPRRVVTMATSASGAYQIQIPLPGDYLVVAVPPDVAPDIDADFVTRFASTAVRVSIAPGETKVQALTVSRPR